MEARGIRCELLAGAIMYYARKYLPGLGRWQSMQGGKARTVTSFSLTPATVDQKVLLESIEKLLPEKKGKIGLTLFSPPSLDLESSPSSEPLRKVARLIDSYLAEVASDSTGHLFQGTPLAFDREKEELCNIIDYQKLSVDACAHASQNERLPLRVILQVLFFEQMHLRTALAGCLNVLEAESAPTGQGIAPTDIAGNVTATSEMAGQIVQRDGWVTVARENRVLKVDMEKMRSRVGELEEEFSKIKQEMKRVTKSHSSLSSPRVVARKFGCKLGAKSLDAQIDVVGSTDQLQDHQLSKPVLPVIPGIGKVSPCFDSLKVETNIG
ncbi:BTB/POZ domain-containing protein [Hibiscus syriacus]|uniref:BTB/POZ domain-containing protein n=1 Tax=Hibiscus syriacus TaxID=106335 RepID=A0A6A3B4B2_HIBSY|nr:BTB/POZ domain-containing protein [Hibiscus syriacus]